jgi:flagellar basal body-associated protein FliL
MTEQSYRDQFKEASAERHHKQKKVILLAVGVFIVCLVVAAAAILIVFSAVPIGDVKLSPTSLGPVIQTAFLRV